MSKSISELMGNLMNPTALAQPSVSGELYNPDIQMHPIQSQGIQITEK